MMHGGIVTALLDKVIGRVAIIHDLWAVTAKLGVGFRHAVPLGQPLTLVGEMTRLRSRTLEARGEIQLEDGTVAAEAEGIYIRLPQEEIGCVGRSWISERWCRIRDDWQSEAMCKKRWQDTNSSGVAQKAALGMAEGAVGCQLTFSLKPPSV
jgi:hypothetical protein